MSKPILTPILALTVLFVPTVALADVVDQVVITEHITAQEGNEVYMPDELLKRIAPGAEVPMEEKVVRDTRPATGRMAGYRVQVFSANNPKAKTEANAKARQVRGRFPQYQTHVMFTSPYWRLRVGDFRTRAEADAAASQIRSAFPGFSKEIRVVKDRVNIVGGE